MNFFTDASFGHPRRLEAHLVPYSHQSAQLLSNPRFSPHDECGCCACTQERLLSFRSETDLNKQSPSPLISNWSRERVVRPASLLPYRTLGAPFCDLAPLWLLCSSRGWARLGWCAWQPYSSTGGVQDLLLSKRRLLPAIVGLKLDRLRRTPAGSTALAFDGTGLCDSLPAGPAKDASYPVSVRQVAALLHTSFRRHLAMTPLCFASPSPPSGWTGDFHSPMIEHAGHTTKPMTR